MDTIAAISTGNQITAIGVLRVSGPEALAAADRVCSAPWTGGSCRTTPGGRWSWALSWTGRGRSSTGVWR